MLETPDIARKMAKESDARIAAGKAGPLEGIPIGVKDLFCTKDVRTTASSHILDNFIPAYESTVTAQLWRDGAVMLGKTNNDEFAMGSSNETSFFGPCNRHGAGKDRTRRWSRAARRAARPRRSPRGSASARPAPIPAARSASRRPLPASSGIKPTYGRCSRWGIVAFASSLDQAGPFARDVRDTAILLRSMAGYDPKDTTSVDRAVPDYEAAIGRSVKGMKIGIPKEYRIDGMAGRDRHALGAGRRLAARGRRRDRRGFAAAHQIRAAGLLHRRAGGSLVQSRAL